MGLNWRFMWPITSRLCVRNVPLSTQNDHIVFPKRVNNAITRDAISSVFYTCRCFAVFFFFLSRFFLHQQIELESFCLNAQQRVKEGLYKANIYIKTKIEMS